MYGAWMYSQLFANWKQIFTEAWLQRPIDPECDHCYQPLHIIQKVLNKNELVWNIHCFCGMFPLVVALFGILQIRFYSQIVVSTILLPFFWLVFLQLAKVKTFYLWLHSCSEKFRLSLSFLASTVNDVTRKLYMVGIRSTVEKRAKKNTRYYGRDYSNNKI